MPRRETFDMATASATKAADEAFQMVTQKVVEAQTPDMRTAQYIPKITAQIDAQIDLLRKAMQVMSDDVAGQGRGAADRADR